MRKLELYVKKYGPEMGRKLYHTLQSQAAHAGVSARLRRKILVLTGREGAVSRLRDEMPLFPELESADRKGAPASVSECSAY